MIVKAIVEVLDWHAVDVTRGLPKMFPVQFNPTQYTRSKTVNWEEAPVVGLPAPIISFVRGNTETLKLDLFFDSTEHGMGALSMDVRLQTRPFHELAREQSKTHAPPKIRVVWGTGLHFKAVVSNVSETYSLFSPLGTPLRATLTLDLKRYVTLEEQLKDLNLQSADRARVYQVKAGDTLSSIAADEYDDPRRWRIIADANADKLDNPRNLDPGMILYLPQLNDAGGQA